MNKNKFNVAKTINIINDVNGIVIYANDAEIKDNVVHIRNEIKLRTAPMLDLITSTDDEFFKDLYVGRWTQEHNTISTNINSLDKVIINSDVEVVLHEDFRFYKLVNLEYRLININELLDEHISHKINSITKNISIIRKNIISIIMFNVSNMCNPISETHMFNIKNYKEAISKYFLTLKLEYKNTINSITDIMNENLAK